MKRYDVDEKVLSNLLILIQRDVLKITIKILIGDSLKAIFYFCKNLLVFVYSKSAGINSALLPWTRYFYLNCPYFTVVLPSL